MHNRLHRTDRILYSVNKRDELAATQFSHLHHVIRKVQPRNSFIYIHSVFHFNMSLRFSILDIYQVIYVSTSVAALLLSVWAP